MAVAVQEIDVEKNGSVAKTLLLTQPRMVEMGAVSRNWALHRQVLLVCAPLSCGLFTLCCLHPPPLADNQKASLFFLHSFSSLATALVRKELSQLNLCGHPKPSPKFCRNSVQLVLGFPQDRGNEKKRKRV